MHIAAASGGLAAGWFVLTLLRRWLGRPVVENVGIDRPFRLRLASVLLLGGGWVVFLASCIVGHWLTQKNVPLAGYSEMLRGLGEDHQPGLQAVRLTLEAVGAAAFIAGLASVSLFDRLDRIPLWRAD